MPAATPIMPPMNNPVNDVTLRSTTERYSMQQKLYISYSRAKQRPASLHGRFNGILRTRDRSQRSNYLSVSAIFRAAASLRSRRGARYTCGDTWSLAAATSHVGLAARARAQDHDVIDKH